MTDATEKCWRCRGDGYFWRVPNGFNPFAAGGWATARASEKVRCYECDGTGKLPRITTSSEPSALAGG